MALARSPGHLEGGGEGDDPDGGAHGDPEQAVGDGGVRVVPGPPEVLDTSQVVRGVDHLTHQPCQTTLSRAPAALCHLSGRPRPGGAGPASSRPRCWCT